MSLSTLRPAFAKVISFAVISACVMESLPTTFADIKELRALGDRHHGRVDQRVVDENICLGKCRDDIERQAAGVARTGAGQPDMAGLQTRRALLQKGQRRLEAHAITFSP